VRGLCKKHYHNFYRNKQLNLFPKHTVPIFEKIMGLIKKQETPSIGTPVIINKIQTQCWLYQGTCPKGYGQIRDGYKRVKVHRFIYWWFFLKEKGIKLKKEDLICHKCDIVVILIICI
jgi:hypothetical protein